MLFNSVDFAIFLPIVFILYWFITNKNLKLQNVLIIIASYFFYGWWDWRFLLLILFNTVVDYTIGIGIALSKNNYRRKALFCTSILVNLGLLCFFKYFNFFQESLIEAFSFFGRNISPASLNIILPVGISFYTFQTLSYIIDVYRKKIEPARDFTEYAAFVSFFPQIVAGPIERASNLLHQFHKRRVFDYDKAVDGLRQILWGLFKKIIVADNCAKVVDLIFNNFYDYSGSSLFLGAMFFTFQIYCDFSGYSDIAIGTARLFGFNLMRNFAFPYFSRDIAEFWRRWHISLTTWFRDYVYIPLGGSHVRTWIKIRNIFVVFMLSGIWHGANWTFVAWGTLNAIYFLPLALTNRNRKNIDIVAQGAYLPSIKEAFSILLTFFLVVISWVFFRSDSIAHAFQYLSVIFSKSLFDIPNFEGRLAALIYTSFIIFFLIIEWFGREQQYAIQKMFGKQPRIMRWGFYSFLIFLIGMYSQTDETPFIYFKF
ncbi:membrane-bound O-acyltransferase family MBOAT [Candidatus Magnetoovum chiemensis]|nr:membrane-bound O-acyltransferase family MBOAT [Candidatus Magnetoovum chiemensis]